MSYQVYQLVNRENGLSYIGFTSNSLTSTRLKFIEDAQSDTSERKIMRAMKNYPAFDMWDILEMYNTPLEIEARMMLNAFISQLKTVDNGYNSHCGEVDSLCNAVAHSVITNQDIQKRPFSYVEHPIHKNVWVFKFYNKPDWSFGFQDENGLWNMYGTNQDDCETASTEVNHHFSNIIDEPGINFIGDEINEPLVDTSVIISKINLSSEYGTMAEDFIDDIDKPTPLQALSQIQVIIGDTHFCTDDDRNEFFNILCGLKGAA